MECLNQIKKDGTKARPNGIAIQSQLGQKKLHYLQSMPEKEGVATQRHQRGSHSMDLRPKEAYPPV